MNLLYIFIKKKLELTLAKLSNKVGIIIPVYNNLHILKKEHQFLNQAIDRCHDVNIEVLLANDGSQNNQKIEQFAKENNYTYLLISPNKGKGNAIREAAKKIQASKFMFTDADIPFDVNTMVNMILVLAKQDSSFIIGDRSLDESIYFNEISAKRSFLSKIFTFFVNKFISYGLNDTQCGLKGFETNLFNKISGKTITNRFTFDAELIHIAKKNKIPIKRIPVKLRNNQNESSVRLVSDSFIMLMDLIKIKTRSIFGFYKV